MPLKFDSNTQIKDSAVFSESYANYLNRALVIKEGDFWRVYDLVFQYLHAN